MTLRRQVSYTLKSLLAHALYWSGALRLLQAVVLRRKAIVLMYHRVLAPDEQRRAGSHPALIVERETFAQQMAVLRRRFRVLSVEQFADYMERRIPFPDSSCLITFDDGWRDNFTNALPALRRQALPAVVFLPIDYIGQERVFWQEALTHLLTRAVEQRNDPARRAAIDAVLAANGLEAVLDPAEPDLRTRALAVVGRQKTLTRAAVEQLLDTLAGALGVKVSDFAASDGFMTWDEVQAMAEGGVSFGGHGVRHLLLTQVSAVEAAGEIHGASRGLHERLGLTNTTFCYPNGYWSPALAAEVRTAGYRLAFITDEGFVTCEDDRFSIRRLGIHQDTTSSTPMFLARILGLW